VTELKISLSHPDLDDPRALLICDVAIELAPGALVNVRGVRLLRSPGGVFYMSWPRTRRGNDWLDVLVFAGPKFLNVDDAVLSRMKREYRDRTRVIA